MMGQATTMRIGPKLTNAHELFALLFGIQMIGTPFDKTMPVHKHNVTPLLVQEGDDHVNRA